MFSFSFFLFDRIFTLTKTLYSYETLRATVHAALAPRLANAMLFFKNIIFNIPRMRSFAHAIRKPEMVLKIYTQGAEWNTFSVVDKRYIPKLIFHKLQETLV